MRSITAWLFGLAALALVATPRDAGAGQKIFFGDIDFDEQLENSYQGSSSALDLKAQDNQDGGPVQIKVEAGTGAQGDEAYTVRLLKRGCKITDPPEYCPGQAEALSPGAGQPTILTVPALQDLNNTSTGGSWYEIEVVATAGAPPNFKTTVGPLQAPATPIVPGTCQNGSLVPGETDTYQFTVTQQDLGTTGEIDVWFDDISISPGSNTVELFDATHVVSKGVDTKSGDVSLDNSEIDTLKLTQAGTYRVNVRNNDAAGQGSYQVCVGPLPEADQGGVCPPIAYATPVPASLAQVGDRDCWTLGPLAVGTELLRINLTESGTTPGTNEVRVQKIAPVADLDASVTGSTSINKTVNVGAVGGETYRITVNNLANGMPNYTLTVTPEGACLGTSCVLAPGGSVTIPIADGGSRAIQANTEAASFQIDPSGSGTWTFLVLDSNNSVLCQRVTNGGTPVFVENCHVGDGTQPAHVQVYGPSGGSVVVSMGPDLGEVAKPCVALDSGDFGLPLSEVLGETPALVGGGDEDCYEFTAGYDERIGLDFESLSISNTKTACIYHYDGAHDWRRNPFTQAETCFSGSGDGTIVGAALVANEDYQLVIDTDKWDDGSYDACLGPEAPDDQNEGDTLTLPANQTLAVDSGSLDACGDADVWTIANGSASSRAVEVEVEEDEAVSGNVYAAVGASSGNARTRVTLPVTLPGNGSVQLTIDHDKFGYGNYVVRVRVPQ